MKIEKLNSDNIDLYIKNMGYSIDDEFTCKLKRDVNRKEYFTICDEDNYYMGFISKSDIDTVAIVNYNNDLNDDKFYECINYLNNSLVVESHLIIEVYEYRYMSLLEDKYRCKEVFVTYGEEVDIDNTNVEEKYAEVEMKSIRYIGNDNMVTCNLVKQNIQDEKLISDLNDYFRRSNVKVINFICYNDSLELFKNMGYECVSKSFVIE